MITWVIGSGGLLGSAVARRTKDRFDAGTVQWGDEQAAADRLRAAARKFCEIAGDDEWGVVWAAGAATTSTRAEQTGAEMRIFEGLLEGIRSALPNGRGSVFITSSAGGVYAGSQNPPFDEYTATSPLSAYGELKVQQELLASEYLQGMCPIAIGRVSNLYGPGQNLGKLQGLISHLAMSAVSRQPINIFVPLDTIRDYIYADDAAAAVEAALTRSRLSGADVSTEVIASGQSTTIGQLISTMNLIARKRVPVALGNHPSSDAQALDLRMSPTYPLEHATTLPAGMKAVYLDILERVQSQTLTA